MKSTEIAVFVLIFVFTGPGYLRADGLDSLIEVGKSQGEIAKAYSEETRTYEGIKRAIESKNIVKGANKKTILEKYRGPVVMVGDYGTDREKWIYKPATSDFSKGPKISLFFTKDGILNEILIEK
ncbi:MAG: hypothetical protein NTZ95_08475 [Candidatus Omnitrophica bacterium]|nr:hypothetical protein [Candidatus Omnitrophota bacterium]